MRCLSYCGVIQIYCGSGFLHRRSYVHHRFVLAIARWRQCILSQKFRLSECFSVVVDDGAPLKRVDSEVEMTKAVVDVSAVDRCCYIALDDGCLLCIGRKHLLP